MLVSPRPRPDARGRATPSTVHSDAWASRDGLAPWHLREIAISTFNRRRRPLKRLGLLSRPRFPSHPHLGFELPGARMPLKRLFHRLEHKRDLGLLPEWRVRRSCSCHTSAAATRLQPTGSTSVSSPVASVLTHRRHQKSTRAAMPARSRTCPRCLVSLATRWSRAAPQSP